MEEEYDDDEEKDDEAEEEEEDEECNVGQTESNLIMAAIPRSILNTSDQDLQASTEAAAHVGEDDIQGPP